MTVISCYLAMNANVVILSERGREDEGRLGYGLTLDQHPISHQSTRPTDRPPERPSIVTEYLMALNAAIDGPDKTVADIRWLRDRPERRRWMNLSKSCT